MEEISLKKSTIWKGATVVVIAVVAFFLFGVNNDGNNVTGNIVGSTDGIAAITTTIQGFKYNPDTFTVNKGDTVKLTIINKDNVLHGLHLPQFGLNGGTPGGTTKTYEFTAIEGPTNGQAMPTCAREHGETLTINVV